MRIIPAFLVLTLLLGGAVLAQETGERPFLGIAFSVEEDGALVREVLAESPAEDAGLLVDDLITGVNGADVAPEELAASIQALAIGEQISLTVLRDGKSWNWTSRWGARRRRSSAGRPSATALSWASAW